MLLTISTTHQPATDLGFLLMKHPDNVHSTDLPFGRAVMFFPQAEETRCTAALTLEVDPVELVRGKGGTPGLQDQYVNDRPYAASSLMSVAIGRMLNSRGRQCRKPLYRNLPRRRHDQPRASAPDHAQADQD